MKQNFIPKHKSDLDACEVLRNTDFEAVQPFAMELFEWVQDINWPVAVSVAAYLSPHSVELSDEITEILRSNDHVWKYWVLIHILDNDFLPQYPKTLTAEIERIAYSPTYGEWEEETDEAAQYFLESFDPGPDDITVLYFELIWEESAADDQKTAFIELLETNLADINNIGKASIKGNKGKIKGALNTALIRKSKGILIRMIDDIKSEMPGVLKKLTSRYE
jgi:hypothetical protein